MRRARMRLYPPTRTHTNASDAIVGKWKGGRVGEVRALRPNSDYGVLVFRAGGKVAVSPKIDDSYRPLVAEIVVLPTAAVLANPCEPAALLIVATVVLLDAQVTCVVRFCVELSV